MAVIINHITFSLHIVILVLIAFIFLGNFFKKKTLLSKYNLYGDNPILISFVAAFINGILLGMDFMYSYHDTKQLSYSLGTITTGAIFVMFALIIIVYYISIWQKNIPET